MLVAMTISYPGTIGALGRATSTTISARLPNAQASRLRTQAANAGGSVSTFLRDVLGPKKPVGDIIDRLVEAGKLLAAKEQKPLTPEQRAEMAGLLTEAVEALGGYEAPPVGSRPDRRRASRGQSQQNDFRAAGSFPAAPRD